MTTRTDPSAFVSKAQFAQGSPVFMRPNVVDRFWGYEISKTVHVIDLAALARGVAILVTISVFAAAWLVWLVPAMAFIGDAMMGKALASASLTVLGFVMLRYAGRSTRVRVQVDTAAGELREVVRATFGAPIVLARHGFDTVDDIKVVTSRTDPTFGQIHMSFRQGGTIAIGDGTVMALRPLRDRLANDCGFVVRETPRVAIWGGPLSKSRNQARAQ